MHMSRKSTIPKNSKVYLDKSYVQLYWNPTLKIIVCRWSGFCTHEEISAVALCLMDIVHLEGAKKILYDSQDMEVLDDASQKFISGAFTKQMIKAGVEYSATVFPEDIFAKFAVADIRKSMTNIKESNNSTFDSMKSALAWLKKKG